MIKLSNLISRANQHYHLNLSADDETVIARKLRLAGHQEQVDEDQVSKVIDEIFALVASKPNAKSSKIKKAFMLGGGPQLSLRALNKRPCPRCKGSMRGAQLHTREMVDFCPKCKIALPGN